MIIESCDIGLVKTKFFWTKPKTWLSVFVRFFINIWNVLSGDGVIPYNHAVVFVKSDGIMWVYEAKAEGIVKSRLLEWKFDPTVDKAIGLHPIFDFNKDIFELNCKANLGLKYDFKATLFHQSIRQLTNETVWIGAKKKAQREMNCSEFPAYLFWLSTKKSIFGNWYMVDPEDLFDTDKFTIYKIK